MNFTTTVLLRFYALEQLWMAEDMDKAPKAVQQGRSIRYAAELSEVPRTCLHRKTITEGNTTKSKSG
jgi:hypothetical protein